MRILAWVRDFWRGVPLDECGRVVPPRKVNDLSEYEIKTRVRGNREKARQQLAEYTRRAIEIGD
jgi:hypothetical protein